MNSAGLTITIGVPGSGKSTWADENLRPETLRLERDRFREALFGSRRAYHDHGFDRAIRSEIITRTMLTAMAAWPALSWAVTDTGLEYPAVKPFIDFAHFAGEPVRLVVIERDDGFLLTNNRIRPHAHRIPEDILAARIAMFRDPEAWWRTSSFEKVFV